MCVRGTLLSQPGLWSGHTHTQILSYLTGLIRNFSSSTLLFPPVELIALEQWTGGELGAKSNALPQFFLPAKMIWRETKRSRWGWCCMRAWKMHRRKQKVTEKWGTWVWTEERGKIFLSVGTSRCWNSEKFKWPFASLFHTKTERTKKKKCDLTTPYPITNNSSVWKVVFFQKWNQGYKLNTL